MPSYEKYTTTVVGAHSVPRWYEALDRLVASGQLAARDFVDAQLRATQAAILEQEVGGIDLITGGEMHRTIPMYSIRLRFAEGPYWTRSIWDWSTSLKRSRHLHESR